MKPAVARFYWSHLPEANKVLDLGCGAGDLARYKTGDQQVYGLDIDSRLVERAKDHEIARQWDLDWEKALPFAGDFFDAVVAKDILEHLQKPWKTVEEIRRVLRPGGLVLASVVCEWGSRTWNDYTHVRGFTMQAARQLFRDAGLRVVNSWRMGGVPFSARFNAIHLIPVLLRVPILHWIWTSSYEIKAQRVGQASLPRT